MSETPPAQTLEVDWPTYHDLVERLVVLVHESGHKFDQILCLARGGLRIGDVFSRVLGLPLATLATSSYREGSGHTQGDLHIAPFVTTTLGTLQGHILVVDDMVDSGHTLDRVTHHLLHTYPGIEALKTAVLWYKAHSVVVPDFYVEKLQTNPWICQPFEFYDDLSATDLAKKYTKGLSP